MTIALRAAYERQKELDRLKDQFIMTASHELRTPLTAVQGYIELLSEYDATLAPDARGKFIEKARRGCHELALLVGNIIDASSIQIEVENINLRPAELVHIVNDIVEILEVTINREQRSIIVHIPSALLVLVDDMRLRQVVLNLVVNALRYSPTGTDIEIFAEEADEFVTVTICDHGFGIPQQDQERLFERFVRLERDMNSPVRGAGLGLYISKQLVTAMGGHIRIESSGRPGEGSRCIFTLKSAKKDQTSADPTYQHSDLSLL
jgi:signal transduction histidine kinase